MKEPQSLRGARDHTVVSPVSQAGGAVGKFVQLSHEATAFQEGMFPQRLSGTRGRKHHEHLNRPSGGLLTF